MGVESGAVEEWSVASDYNRMDHVRLYHAHQARVTQCLHAGATQWILSSGRDKYFYYHCSSTGKN